MSFTAHQIYDTITGIVFVSSLVYSLLPPWEWFDKWPNFQAIYKIIVMTIARWGSANLRKNLYPQTAIENQIDKAISGPVKTQGGTNDKK
jgi:hypothetical protein